MQMDMNDNTHDQDGDPGAPTPAPADGAGQSEANESAAEPLSPSEDDELTALRARLDQLEAELVETKDAYLRAMAETENLRRRAARERQDLQRYAAADPIKDCLAVADNLRRAIDSIDAAARADDVRLDGLLEGVEATERQLLQAFEKHGVKRIEALGKPFDHQAHEAMFEIEDAEHPSGTVLQEMAPGYMLHDRLLRPAMVGVSKGGPARAAAPSEPPGERRADPSDPYAGPERRDNPEFDTNA
jgi:molecular chaperone GrpE